MTFGNGANGCLGHGNLLDVKEVLEAFNHQSPSVFCISSAN